MQIPELIVMLVEPEERELARLRQELITIGKRPSCAVCLVGSIMISGTHAVLTWRDEALWVDDPHGSRHDVTLRGQRVIPGSPVRLASGDRLRLGDRVIEVRFEAPAHGA